MVYPNEFKQKVLKVYSNNKRMYKALELGSEDVGRILCYDCGSGGVAYKDILKCNSLEEVKQLAKEGCLKYALYKEWCCIKQ